VTNYPNLNFTVIINPSSGPGNSSQPSPQYAHQIQRLNAYPNVRTVGYVRTGYASRNLSTVLQEVGIYSGWAAQSPTLAMHGIFFDEVPSEYATSAAEYLATINAAAKNASGLRLDRTVCLCCFIRSLFVCIRFSTLSDHTELKDPGALALGTCLRLY
jgi:hypothetical protein